MLLPMMLPMVMPVLPWTLAVTFTASSGSDVPNATTVRPTARSETRNLRASDDAASTKTSAPLINNANPTGINR